VGRYELITGGGTKAIGWPGLPVQAARQWALWVREKEIKVKVNCLGCGFKVDLADAYDDYEGPIKCYACGSIMEISTQEGSIRAVRPVAAPLGR
jgi:hypothetical protein